MQSALFIWRPYLSAMLCVLGCVLMTAAHAEGNRKMDIDVEISDGEYARTFPCSSGRPGSGSGKLSTITTARPISCVGCAKVESLPEQATRCGYIRRIRSASDRSRFPSKR
jgi:hypothetical protein